MNHRPIIDHGGVTCTVSRYLGGVQCCHLVGIVVTLRQPEEDVMAASETETKNMTLRLDRALANQVQAVAEVEGRSVANVVRDAIVQHVDQRRRDPRFHELLEESMKRHERLLELLADR